MNTFKSKDSVTKAITVFSALLILFYFLPIADRNFGSVFNVPGGSISMAGLTFGVGLSGFGSVGSFLYIIMLAFPVIFIVIWMFKPIRVKTGLTFAFTVIMTGVYLIALSAWSVSGVVSPWAVITVIVLFLLLCVSTYLMTAEPTAYNINSGYQGVVTRSNGKVNFTVRTLMSIGSALFILFFFLPIFAVGVRTYGLSIGISVSNFACGAEFFGNKVPVIIVFILMLILPIIQTFFWLFRAQGKIAAVSMTFTCIITGMYIVFAVVFNTFIVATGAIEESVIGSSSGIISSLFSITAWLVIAIIIGIIMIVLSILLITQRAVMETNIRNIKDSFTGRPQYRNNYGNYNYTGNQAQNGYQMNTPQYRQGADQVSGNYADYQTSGNYAAGQTQTARPAGHCPRCGAELAAGADFCQQCGEKIVRKVYCAGCGAELRPGVVYCPNCGTQNRNV